ncbi:hypothetical protein UCD39_24965 [Nitrospirillum sp. BR 11752]|uniref:hypothetical protein n=1 Tax=Nitrospirillum sp. BR 11752 TaxID=3104293 RepID=UPI002EB5303D|nr:hypothetical protein [Nitrospirillum sp. BR 11752]
MPIGVQLNAVFNIDSNTYTASMSLPTAAPTGAAPFLFKVTSAPTTTPTNLTTLLTVAVGSTSEVYVAIAPPADLIAAAAGSNIVSALDVVVSEGTFDPSKGTFSST